MLPSLEEVFSGESFIPHGHCYLWNPGLIWLQVSANALIGLAYIAISSSLAWLVLRAKQIPFKVMYVAFGVFIVSCGITHFFDVATVWHPVYWLDGAVRALTALVSVGTAIILPPLIPRVVALARGANAAHDKGIRLETAVKDLATMYERARELEQLKTQFFANVSHELRTPLTLVLGPVEKLLAQELRDDQRQDLEVVRRNAKSLLKQVNDLLDVSRLEAGRMHADYVDTDLAQLLRSTAAQFEAHAQERQVKLEVHAPLRLSAQVDPDQIQAVMTNLLSNSFKFTPPGGLVRLVAEEDRGEAVIEVGDSGPGIRAEDREIVFERFRQLDAGSARRFAGTGLGLAIVRDFVLLHRGSVKVDASPEGGALFSVRIPLRAPEGATVRASQPPPTGASERTDTALASLRTEVDAFPAAANAEKPLVLVVEDNQEMNRFICQTLAPACRAEPAFDGEEALRRSEELRPDLILSDVMMPKLSGEQLVRELRARTRLDLVPIVLLTAKADDELRVKLLNEGAQDYVMKPFRAQELRARVGNLVTMKRARELLQVELQSQRNDLAELAREVTDSRRELQGALATVQAARDQAEEALRVRSQFLGLVSHELRTPLTSLRLQIERLARDGDALPEQDRALVARMSSSAIRLTELVESLLQFTRMQAGRLETQETLCDLGELAREIAEELRPQAERRKLRLTASGAASAETDPHLVRLMTTNLAANALKFTEQGGVSIAVSNQNGEVRIDVADSGPGIAFENHGRIFEPFEHLEPISAKHTPGIGLGLALVKEMAKALGARVELQSEPGKGSTFSILLPRDRSA
jgi:signal transduction histidine kinase